MSKASRILINATLATACALAFSASAVQATPGHGMDCAFTGLAGNITGAENPAGVESLTTDLSRTNQPGSHRLLDTDSGTYTFAGFGSCLVSNATGVSVDTVHIASSGEYMNTVCGTGTLWSTNTTVIRRGGPTGPLLVNDVRYNIDFVAGNGALRIQAARDATDGNTGEGGGYVHIQPTHGGNCVTTDVPAFDVAGAFSIVEGPDAVTF